MEKTYTKKEWDDLMNDLAHVVEINREIADKYQFVMNYTPNSIEMKRLIANLEDREISFEYSEEERKERIKLLKGYLSIVEAWERQDERVKPVKYDDLPMAQERDLENRDIPKPEPKGLTK